SPNAVFYNFHPGPLGRATEVQNSLLNDPPTSYLTLISLLKSDWGAFHWNPFVAGGIPGFGSSASAALTPFILIPALLLPLAAVYIGIIVLKLNASFLFAYLWLREERLGKRGAAIGAIIFAASGVFAVRWLWQATNATALYPALLWLACRAARGRRTSLVALTLIALAYALAGFPATMAYGAWIVAIYFLYLCIRWRRIPLARVGEGLAATAIALMIAAPSIVPLVQFVRRTGYLGSRGVASSTIFFPRSEWLSFIRPDRLGNPAYHNWTGAAALGAMNNYVEASVYAGILAIVLVPIALLDRRARNRWFWIAAMAVILGGMFGSPLIAPLLARLPGIKYSPMTRLQMLLPVACAYLAASGASLLNRKVRFATTNGRLAAFRAAAGSIVSIILIVAASGDLAVFAGRFYPYLEPASANVPATPTIAYLQSQRGAFRVAPFFNYLWPNSSELFRIEDVRSHFSSEEKYRRLLTRIDPSCWGGMSTILQFNSLQFHFDDPLTGMLGIRYYVEHKAIDIIRWSIFKSTVPGVKEDGAIRMTPGMALERTILVDAEPFYAAELPVNVEQTTGPAACLRVALKRASTGELLWQRAFTPADLAVMQKAYVPIRPFARLGDALALRVEAVDMTANLLRSVPVAGEAPLFYGRVTGPVIFDRELPDGRLFLNLGEVPRFHAVWKWRHGTEAQFLADRAIDFGDEAFVTDGNAGVPDYAAIAARDRTARLRVRKENEGNWQIDTDATVPFFLASSEKLTPELQIRIDGAVARAIEINSLFAGVPVGAGKHTVRFERRIGRGWWPIASLGVILLVAGAVVDRRSFRTS
ncbi:MAG TPA: hypothetical protein VEZ11_16335, partial [Thermoanaerobaculia bacterium]|nr:hypothetical protein [Thermoanaerobaculia bacterium]